MGILVSNKVTVIMHKFTSTENLVRKYPIYRSENTEMVSDRVNNMVYFSHIKVILS